MSGAGVPESQSSLVSLSAISQRILMAFPQKSFLCL
jgi:hypothetical protein